MNTEKEKNIVVRIFENIINVISDLLVALFDGILRGIEHATPSSFALDASLLPWVLPLPIAFMTAESLENYFAWEHWSSLVMGLGLEGLGILVWARLADAVVQKQLSKQAMYMLYAVAAIYEAIIILLNVVLALRHGIDGWYALVLFLVCLLPALSATLYGFYKWEVNNKLEREREEAKAQKERERQERREDKLKALELKRKFQSEEEAVKLKKFRKQ